MEELSKKTSPLTRAEAWCWVAWMFGRESDALVYKYPRTDEDMAAADELRDAADAFYNEAVELDSDEGLWRRSLDKFDGRVPA